MEELLRHNEVRKTGARFLAVAALLCLLVPAARAEVRAVKSKVAPVYPEIAKRMRIAGVVKLEVKVDPNGAVTDVKTVAGNHMLASAAEDAVKKWKFVSADGATTDELEVNFSLSGQ